MEVSFFVDQNISIFYGCTFVFGLVEISQQKVASGLMFLRVQLVILEQCRDERSLAYKKVPKQTIERIFLSSVLIGSDFLNDLLEFLSIVVPKWQSKVPHPIPIDCRLIVFELSQCFFFVERVRK